ncbi:hypothetical protein [Escherichia coli]|uniref:hypothetical protein n=1 Tax=Escherichia coli TaxID=562 RepID=UPI000BE55B0B|nr:hypothetical protein [Escherichia coli]
MNAKTEGTIDSLKMLSTMEYEMYRECMKTGAPAFGLRALTASKVTAIAAEIIEKQHDEISALKAQLASASTSLPVKGQRVFIINNPSQELIILSEMANGYLITPFPTDESKPLKDVRIVARNRIAFTDPAASSTFNA